MSFLEAAPAALAVRRASVVVPSPLRAHTGGRREVAVDAATVGDAVAELARLHPELRRHLYAETGQLRGFVSVFVNGVNIRDLDGAATPLAEAASVVIVPSIAGG
jgi:molybdopterin converting factor small subunit